MQNKCERGYDGKDFPMCDVIKIGQINREKNLSHANALSKPVQVKNTLYTRYVKRTFDIVISLAALVVFLPVNLVLAVITYFDVGRPILFRQTRMGKDKRKFQIIKFRNMRDDRDARGELLPPEERVTKWGRIVRRTSLDELLNFWLILKGDMSIIGPRPLHDFYAPWMTDRHAARFAVRPGLECPMLQRRMRVTNWQDRFENDVWYVENCSLTTDLKLLFRLFQMTLFPENREERETATGAFIGYDEQGLAVGMQNVPESVMQAFWKTETATFS